MGNLANTIVQTYGLLGILILLLAGVCYLIWGDRKNNWGSQITTLEGKHGNTERRMDLVEGRLDNMQDDMQKDLNDMRNDLHRIEQKIDAGNDYDEKINYVKEQSTGIMIKGIGGKLSAILKNACQNADCDHIFLGSFHNGVTDLRGIHYCKFDVVIDEYRDPLHLRKTDVDFSTLYKDENVLAYGDLPPTMARVGGHLFDLENQELFDLNDTLYRRCKSRDIKQLAFYIIKDKAGLPMGFVGAVSYIKREIKLSALAGCAHEIENIYNE